MIIRLNDLEGKTKYTLTYRDKVLAGEDKPSQNYADSINSELEDYPEVVSRYIQVCIYGQESYITPVVEYEGNEKEEDFYTTT